MRICQISDIHWRGISRHSEYTDSFERLFEKLSSKIKPDIIVNTGDTFHTKTHGITPEVIERLSWMFRGLADIAPTIHILGNHDGNLTNAQRQDLITPIHDAVSHKNSFLFKFSGTHKLCNLDDIRRSLFVGDEVLLHVFSPFDKKGWSNVAPDPSKINVALFHGSVAGSRTDGEFVLFDSEVGLDFFKGHDFVLLGDIHKNQVLARRKDRFGKERPWIAYPGSLIQQNFGESVEKGFLVWNIEAKDIWSCEFVQLENRAPFITVPWMGTVSTTLRHAHEISQNGFLLPGTKLRITSSQPIQNIETRQLLNELKTHCGISEVVFKYNTVSNLDVIDAAGKKLLKTDLRHDPDSLMKLYVEFLSSSKDNSLNDYQKNVAKDWIKKYLDRFNSEEAEVQNSRANSWSIKSLKFDNVFRYGEDNFLDFESLNGIVGIFGPNKTGKSSTIGALMYALFNTTDRGPLKGAHIINKNKNFCSAEVRFSVGNSEYLIVRETVRNVPKRNPKKEDYDKTITTLNLYRIMPDGSRQEMNSVSKDDTDKEIRKLIGSSQDFLLTALSSQGGIGRFIEEGASQRKAILNKFLDLDIFEKLFSYAKEDFSLINEKTKKYSQTDWSETISRLDKEIEELEGKSQFFQQKLARIVSEKEELRLWILQHQKVSLEDVAKLKELKNLASLREKNIASLTKTETQLKNEISELVLEKQRIVEERQKYDVEALRQKIEQLENLKLQLNELAHQHDTQKNVLNNQLRSVKKLEVVPCGDMFPTCQFIKDSHEDKKKIAEQTRIVNEIAEAIQTCESMIRTLTEQNVLAINEKILSEEERQKELEYRLAIISSNLSLTSKNLEDSKQSLGELEARIAEIESNISLTEKKEMEKKQFAYEVLDEESRSLTKEHQNLLFELGGKVEHRRRIMEERASCKQDLEMLKIHDSIQAAFSKNGIPALILKTQLPIINSELQKILEGFVDFKVTLETDVNANVMDVYLEDSHSKRIIELASGMEKMISSLAIRVALINLSSLPRSDMFIVDEGWGSLDAENLQKVSSFLAGLRCYFKTILLISHIQEVKEAADFILEVQNNNNESHIKYNGGI
jgi:DNA repair exonuclease SbcCD ATPase subunit/3',5'-cyclic AMP phosphodiesterase CpdA